MLYSEPIPLAVAAVAAAACLVMAMMGWRVHRRRRRAAPAGKSPAPERPEGQALLTRYRPNAVRVLTASEREAFDRVREALPSHFVMAQVPLVRYLRVEDKRVEDDWLRGLSMLSADILVCDTTSRPVLAVDILPPKPGARSRERHERMRQLLEGAGIRVIIWQEGRIPTGDEARTELQHAIQLAGTPTRGAARPARAAKGADTPKRPATPATSAQPRIEPELGAVDASAQPAVAPGPAHTTAPGLRAVRSGGVAPLPLIPVPEISELLAEGDEIAARHSSLDPVSLTFFDEFEPRPHGSAAPLH